ncbi:MAG: TonB-dependent receptor plug domain-containing protein, partial [Cyanobacteria bacterium J06631_9]
MRLWTGLLSLIGMLMLLGPVARAEEVISQTAPALTVAEWVAQIEASLVQITDVRIEETDAGLQVVLETAAGTLAEPTTTTAGDALILEIANAVLVGDGFEEFAPAEGIALVQVSPLAGDRVQVVVTGADAVPEVAVGSDAAGLTLSVVPGVAQAAEEGETIQLVVTGEEDEGYNPSSASTATRTDTPLRDIPQSIQVVPQQVIEDRNVRTITEAVETVSGVVEDFRFFNGTSGNRRIRGFTASSTLRNDFPESSVSTSATPLATIEQLEILKGPSSVITGAIDPGGVVNYVTRQPLSEPYYNLDLEIGNFGLYQPSVDVSGPLTNDRDALYRFIAAYENRDSFQEFANSEVTSIAPSVLLNLGDHTDLNLYYEYSRYFAGPYQSGVPLLSDGSLPSRSLYPSSPFLNRADFSDHKTGYTLTHRLDSDWQIRNNFTFTNTQNERREIFPLSLTDDRFLSLATFNVDANTNNYFAGVDLLGEFETGNVEHRLLVGFDFNYFDENS